MPLVNTLKGAVSFGVFGLSLLPNLDLLDFGVAFGLESPPVPGGVEGIIVRPFLILRVVVVTSSCSVAELGVSGEPENISLLFYSRLAIVRKCRNPVHLTGSLLNELSRW